jgi:hypothetical protein
MDLCDTQLSRDAFCGGPIVARDQYCADAHRVETAHQFSRLLAKTVLEYQHALDYASDRDQDYGSADRSHLLGPLCDPIRDCDSALGDQLRPTQQHLTAGMDGKNAQSGQYLEAFGVVALSGASIHAAAKQACVNTREVVRRASGDI